MNLPRRISKKELCLIFKLYSPATGRFYYTTLRDHYFTAKNLEKLEMSREEYKKIRTFDFDQTKQVLEVFGIVEEERIDEARLKRA